MFIVCSGVDAVSSGNWYILFKVPTLNIVIHIVLLHLRNFCLCWSSVAGLLNNGARDPTSAERAPFLPA